MTFSFDGKARAWECSNDSALCIGKGVSVVAFYGVNGCEAITQNRTCLLGHDAVNKRMARAPNQIAI